MGRLERESDGLIQLRRVEAPDLDVVVHAGRKQTVARQGDVSVEHLRPMTFHAAEHAYVHSGGDVPQAHCVVWLGKRN